MKVIQPRPFHPWKTLWVLSVLIVFFVYLSLRDTPGPRHPSWQGQTMGTLYSIRLADSTLTTKQLKELQAQVDDLLIAFNRQMSHYDPESELSRFNASTSAAPFTVSPSFARVTRFALWLNNRSRGLFDPTLGPLIRLWGFGPGGRILHAPDDAAIAQARNKTGARFLRVIGNDRLQKDIPELELNLSAVAKGAGVDEVARFIMDRGATNVFVEIGGEVVAYGHNAKGQPWRVGIETPRPDALPGEAIELVIELSGKAIATSGDYRNYFEDENGRRFSHILNPTTGRPIEHNLASVSVIAPDCMTADGLATTLFVMGLDEGMPLVESWPDAEALFITRESDGTFKHTASAGFPTEKRPEED